MIVLVKMLVRVHRDKLILIIINSNIQILILAAITIQGHTSFIVFKKLINKKYLFMRSQKLFMFLLIMVICFIPEIVEAQRGGGSSSSSSSKSRSRSRSSFGSFFKSSKKDKKSSEGWSISFIVTCGVAGIGLIREVFAHLKRKKRISSIMHAFQEQCIKIPSTTSEEQRTQITKALKQNLYEMNVMVKDQSQKFSCELKVTQIEKITDHKYNVAFSGKDVYGSSTFSGVLIFKGSGFGLKLSKIYSDRQKSRQKDKFDILIYEGKGDRVLIEKEIECFSSLAYRLFVGKAIKKPFLAVLFYFYIYPQIYQDLNIIILQMRSKVLHVFLFFVVMLLLLQIIEAQRGGGGGGGGRSSFSSGSRHKSSGSSFSYLLRKSNKDKIKIPRYQKYLLFYGACACALIWLFLQLYEYLRRKMRVRVLMKNYQAKILKIPCQLNEEEKAAIINQFKRNRYVMNVRYNNQNTKSFKCDLKVTRIDKQTDRKYRILFAAQDEVGKSNLDGIIVFKRKDFGIKLSKVYQNREKAGQTKAYENLLLEGEGPEEGLQGQWAFQGFEYYDLYSGKWSMSRKIQEK